MMQKNWKWRKSWHMGTLLRILSESYPMNTNMTGFGRFSKIFVSLCFVQKEPQHWRVKDDFQKYLCPYSLDESSLSIGGVNHANNVCFGLWGSNFQNDIPCRNDDQHSTNTSPSNFLWIIAELSPKIKGPDNIFQGDLQAWINPYKCFWLLILA